eukprot:jgi/Botrbrau1/19285/Bobra.0073s0028.1
MFENQVAFYLNRYLGTYVYGVDPQSLKISVLKGDVVLHNLRLKPEALADLNLPITVKAGLLGTLTLKVPWANLGGSPVIVEIDRLYILATPGEFDPTKQPSNLSELGEGELELKEKRVRDAETAWEHTREKAGGNAPDASASGGGMFRGLIDRIIGNLQMNITNIHVRYEDAVSYKPAPFAVGFTLEGLNAFTVDENGSETFVTHNPLDLLRKASQLRRLALYFDVGTTLWGTRSAADWQAMTREQWDALFERGIAQSAPGSPTLQKAVAAVTAVPADPLHRTYVLKPVDGRLRYLRRGRDARKTEKEAVQEMDLELETISLHISRPQYQSLQSLLEAFNGYSARAPTRQLRPGIRPTSRPAALLWWHFAVAAIRARQQGPVWSTTRLLQALKLRNKYIAHYRYCLEEGTAGGDAAIREMDQHLNESTILVFRRLAYLQVEAARKAAGPAAPAAKPGKRSWVGWLMGEPSLPQGAAGGPGQEAEGDIELRSELTPEEVAQLQEMAAEQQSAMASGQQSPHSLLMQVSIGVHSASVVLDGSADSPEVLRAGLEELAVGLNMYPGTTAVKVGVAGMGVRSPEGNLVRTGDRLHSSKSGAPPGSAPIGSWASGGDMQPLSKGEAATPGNLSPAALKALELEYIQKPQDGSADAVLHLALAPSYVTYHRRTIDRVTHFFHTEKELDLSALGAQAIAQVERAQKAAREQLAAALNRKPRLILRLQLDAPKIAIPVPATDGEAGRLTLVADLGTFLIESDAEAAKKLSDEEAAVYQCARVSLRDISAYVVDGDFSFRALERAGADLCNPSNGETPRSPVTEAISFAVRDADGVALGGAARFIPLLERTGAETSLQLARLDHPTLPSVRLHLNIPKLRFFYSPARVRRCLRVLRAAVPAAPAEVKGPKPKQGAVAGPAWRANAEYSGSLRMLEWGGIGRITATWLPRWAVLYRGRLYLLDGPNSIKPLQTCTFWNNKRICSVPEDAVGGIPYVIAIMPRGAEAAKVAETKGCLVLRLNSDDEAKEWRKQLGRSQEMTQEVSGGSRLAADFGGEDASSDDEEEREDEDTTAEPDQATAGPKACNISISAELGELALFISGRTPNTWWPPDQEGAEVGKKGEGGAGEDASSGPAGGPVDVDGERGLVVIRAMSGSTSVGLATGHMSTHFGIGAFEMEDLLVGPRCPEHRYLGRSFVATEGLELDDVDVEFFDVDPEPSSPMRTASSGTLDSGAASAHSNPQKTAWALVLETWAPGHPQYTGVDSELRMTLTTLYFFCNRPTIGALIGVGIDTGAAFTSSPSLPPTPPNTTDPTPRPTGEEEQLPGASLTDQPGPVTSPESVSIPEPLSTAGVEEGTLVKEGGAERVIFRLNVEVEKLEVVFNYESATAAPLGIAYVERVVFCLGVHPTSIVIDASLGNMKAVDGALPEGHPYRNVIGLRSGASTSLIQVALSSHVADTGPAGDRIPPGLPYWTLTAEMRELEIFFLYRFLQEILRYIFLMLRLQPEYAARPVSPGARPGLSQPGAAPPEEEAVPPPTSRKPAQAPAMPFLILLDIKMEAPVIILPRNSDSSDSLEVDLGKLILSNRVLCLGPGLPTTPKAVLQDDMVIQLLDLGGRVISGGVRAANLVRDYDAGLKVFLQRPLRDPLLTLPTSQVRVSIPSITLAYSDKEYHFTISVTGDNFAEPVRIPEPALWLEQVYMPEPAEQTEKEMEAAAEALLKVPTTESRSRSSSPQRLPAPQSPSSSGDSDKVAIHVVVEVGKLELVMFQTLDQVAGSVVPLASFGIGKLWVCFRSTRGGSMGVRLSIPRVEGLDRRPWVPKDHSRIISSEVTSDVSSSSPPQASSSGQVSQVGEGDPAPLTFLVLEWSVDRGFFNQSLQLRLQRPTISAEMSLLLAITKFYVPSFFLTGVAPIPFHSEDILLTDAEHHATGDVWLCPETRILADAPGVDDYVYEGNGHRIILPEGICGEEGLPLILVGPGKTLHLRDVKIVHAASLPACLQLSAGAQLFAHPADNVYRLEGSDSELDTHSASPGGRSPARSISWGARTLSRKASTFSSTPSSRVARTSVTIPEDAEVGGGRRSSREGPEASEEGPRQTRFQLDIVAVGLGLRFMELDAPDPAKSAAASGEGLGKRLDPGIDDEEQDGRGGAASRNGPEEGVQARSVRMLAAYLDLSASYISEAGHQKTHCQLRGLQVETQTSLTASAAAPHFSQEVRRSGGRVQATVLEPCKLVLDMGMGGAAPGDISLCISDVRLNLSPDVLELLLALQASVLQPLIHPSPDRPLARCSRFVSVWSSGGSAGGPAGELAEPHVIGTDSGVTFWRPQAPTGYAPLGDCITRGDRQPTYQVVTVAVNSGLVMFPEGFDKICTGGGVTVWLPRPPPDYVSLGCVATAGNGPPASNSVACIHQKAVIQASLGPCLLFQPPGPSPKPDPQRGSSSGEGPQGSAQTGAIASLWCIDNCAATFLACTPQEGTPSGAYLDLRSPLGITPAGLAKQASAASASPTPPPSLGHSRTPSRSSSLNASSRATSAPPVPIASASSKGLAGSLGSKTSQRSPETQTLSSPSTPPPLGSLDSGRLAGPSVAMLAGYRSYRRFVDQRAHLLQRASHRRLRSSTADFRRVWWDKHARNPSRLGVSIWRPIPPPGYVALGDCVDSGYDPPQSVLVLRDSDVGGSPGGLGDFPPLLKPPSAYKLIWRDESSRQDRALSIWSPVPYPGYVGMGYVASIGNQPPSRTLLRCVRADSAEKADLHAMRAAARLPVCGRRTAIAMWRADDRLGTFIVTPANAAPANDDLWRFRLQEPAADPSTSSSDTGGCRWWCTWGRPSCCCGMRCGGHWLSWSWRRWMRASSVMAQPSCRRTWECGCVPGPTTRSSLPGSLSSSPGTSSSSSSPTPPPRHLQA